ncbi:MAG: RnfABCDGE type electron transport complex subunit D, partial [Oscillospiraceae bacterium]|nr:RnfABCDGE type electron transport complex subunit D [Oscillospiraceae bacterium]
MNMDKKLTVTSSPHLRAEDDTQSIMLDVILALAPALLAGVWAFGFRAFVMTCVSAAACVIFEWGYRKLLKKSNDVKDLSAIVTGMLIAYTLPPTAPLWLPVLGALFAIVLVKQLFGGIGKNFMNPALAARAFLFSYPVIMTTWAAPHTWTNFFNMSVTDAVTGATPLSFLHRGVLPEANTLGQAFWGTIGGSMGELSAFALILGGIYLMIRRVISWRIPGTYLLTV